MIIDESRKSSPLYPVLVCFAAVFLMFLDGGRDSWVRNGISYIFTPSAFYGSEVGSGLRSYLNLFSDISDFRQEYKDLGVEVVKMKGSLEYLKVLERENEALKKQLELGDKENKYVLADLVWANRGAGGPEMVVNMGRESGITKSDIVSIGNLYVGLVEGVSSKSSSLRLATNRSSRLQVLIFEGGDPETLSTEEIGRAYISKGGVGAVAVGQGEGVRIENIPINSGVKEGDTVIIADERVGEYLVLGRIGKIDTDIAAASLSSSLELLTDYSLLTKVFIRVN